MKRVLVVIGLWCACGDNEHPATVVMEVGSEPPAYGHAPFPTDALRDGPHLGVLRGFDSVVGAHADLIAAHLEALDGYGLRPAIEFPIEGYVDEATIPATTARLEDAAIVIDVDTTSNQHLTVTPFDWKYDADRQVIVGAPHMGAQLREGTRYAAVLTTDILGKDGRPLFGAYGLGKLDHAPPDRWKTTAQALADLRALPQLTSRIAAITVFTTQHASDVLRKAREVIENTAAVPAPSVTFADPAIVFDTAAKLDDLLGGATRFTSGPRAGTEHWGLDDSCGYAHDHIAVVATGTTTIARFRRDDTGTDGPEDETFELGAYGVPNVQSIDSIPITFVLPKGPVPADGFPVIIFGHGLGGSRADLLAIAEPLAAQGYAMVAIDMWGHGSRYNATDVRNNFAGTKAQFSGVRELRDGFGDNVGLDAYYAFFEGFLNIAAIRDSIRQSALDFARVALLIQQRSLDLSALSAPYGAAPKLDPKKVAYLGQSFGTIVGTDLAAIEPSVRLYVLDVAGGGVLDQIVPNSPGIGSLAIPFANEIYRARGTLDRFHPAFSMMQAVFDGADSLTFARHVLKNRLFINGTLIGPRHVIAIEALHDELMPNTGTEALAFAFGMAVLKPDLDPPPGMAEINSPAMGNVNGQTAVLVQYEPATHGYNWSAEHGDLEYKPGGPYPGDDMWPKLPAKITIAEPIYETHAQVAQILSTFFAGLTPVVVSTKPPVADFDGDGKPDSTDPDPWDPTK